jgi:hypothetical protein
VGRRCVLTRRAQRGGAGADDARRAARRSTGETTWEKPAGSIVEAEPSPAGGPTAIVGTEEVGRTGWNEVRMSDGTSYYFHQASHQTTWDVPPEVAQAKRAMAAPADKPGAARPQVDIPNPAARKAGLEPPPPGLSPRPESKSGPTVREPESPAATAAAAAGAGAAGNGGAAATAGQAGAWSRGAAARGRLPAGGMGGAGWGGQLAGQGREAGTVRRHRWEQCCSAGLMAGARKRARLAMRNSLPDGLPARSIRMGCRDHGSVGWGPWAGAPLRA